MLDNIQRMLVLYKQVYLMSKFYSFVICFDLQTAINVFSLR
jgi:hypothetical protein